MKKRGEEKLAGFAAKVDAAAGPVSKPGLREVSEFVVIYNPTDAVAKVDGVRLRPRSGVVKTAGGRDVLGFDENGGVTYDSKLAAPLLDAFGIPRDE